MISSSATNPTEEQQHLPFWIIWHIWKSRNNLIFNKVSWELGSIIRKAKEDVLERNVAKTNQQQHVHASTNNTGTHITRWTPPPTRLVKVNVDGSFNYQNVCIGARWIVRDDSDNYCLAGSAQLKQAFSLLEAEGIALL
ncbi:hypothetical protein V5N11_025493 [Cardamine amara subsp. amara]|uniref:RNase H type-1 domain-containing protein n=1 Tax=Cardamine amara subsp. amara TaxID=228776 RepID=A0ABD1BXV1_CARAN